MSPHERSSRHHRHVCLAVIVLGVQQRDRRSRLDAVTTTSVETSTTVTDSTVADTTSTSEATDDRRRDRPPTAPPSPRHRRPPARAPGFYEQVPPPVAPTGHTDPFVSSGVLGDGYYWVQYNGGETMTPDITVMQAFFGAECGTEAAADGDECLNDIYVRGDPSRDIDDLPFADDVCLTVADSSQPFISYVDHARRAAHHPRRQPQRRCARGLQLRRVPVADDGARRRDREVRTALGAVARPGPRLGRVTSGCSLVGLISPGAGRFAIGCERSPLSELATPLPVRLSTFIDHAW